MEKLKAGIITFHRATNYGAVLQAYALQNALKYLGVDVDIIDNRNDRVDVLYSKFRPSLMDKSRKISYHSILGFISQIINYEVNVRKRKLFDDFIEQYLCISSKYNSYEELQLDECQYDFFICGSDQVWNLGITDNNGIYFLNFTSGRKRNSYAASLGSAQISEFNANIYRNYLKDFSYVSVREKSNVEVLGNVYGKEVKCVLDPTFLLSENDWIRCCVPIDDGIPEKFILFYELYDLDNQKLHEFVIGISKATGYPIVHIGNNRKFKCHNLINCIPSPDQWVWLFRSAQYVVTNSFHGTVFSINFHKQFYTGLLVPDGRHANVRMNDILNELGLSDRIIDYSEKFDENVLLKRVDWRCVDKLLSELKKSSFEFLNEIVQQYKNHAEDED